jgi:hypothetical protein
LFLDEKIKKYSQKTHFGNIGALGSKREGSFFFVIVNYMNKKIKFHILVVGYKL